jgi:hypothetical protein
MPPPPVPACQICRFSHGVFDNPPPRGPSTHCRRFPPGQAPGSFEIEGGQAGPYAHPIVALDDWCGEYQP